ncbi:GNAT family N-acetyltransferase [Kitasatospora sp. NPDC001539]|uniref:GNAT family N-acetyltransferase n=1 Tax=Kitasatospora sp. NPDC001539 TaxID=3154384 RepID=UPI00332956EB
MATDRTDRTATDRPAVDHRSPDGARFERTVPGFGTVTIRPLDPAADAEVVHAWVDDERARFWGMVGRTREQVRETYEFVDSLETHHAYLVRHDGAPAALFQTYLPEHDPLGEHYPVQDGDLGVHLLVAPADAPRRGYTHHLIAVLIAFLFADPYVRRIVAEPDVRNEKSVARLLRSGFEPGPQLDLAEKRAQLVLLTRDRAEALAAADRRVVAGDDGDLVAVPDGLAAGRLVQN